jgi:hypothetical protein
VFSLELIQGSFVESGDLYQSVDEQFSNLDQSITAAAIRKLERLHHAAREAARHSA